MLDLSEGVAVWQAAVERVSNGLLPDARGLASVARFDMRSRVLKRAEEVDAALTVEGQDLGKDRDIELTLFLANDERTERTSRVDEALDNGSGHRTDEGAARFRPR